MNQTLQLHILNLEERTKTLEEKVKSPGRLDQIEKEIVSLKEAVAKTHPVPPSTQARSHNSVWQHSGQPQTGPRTRRSNPKRHSASTEPNRGATVKPPPSNSTHTSATSRRSGTTREGRRSPNPFSDSFRLVWGTRYTTPVPTIRTAIARILKERFTEEIIVVRSVKRRVDKTSWWFTVMAPPDTLESLDSNWESVASTYTTGSCLNLLTLHHPTFTRLLVASLSTTGPSSTPSDPSDLGILSSQTAPASVSGEQPTMNTVSEVLEESALSDTTISPDSPAYAAKNM